MFERIIRRTAILVGALVLIGTANPSWAQQAWDTNVLNWSAPTTCTTGEPITSCPVTGYRVEQSATSSGAFTTLTTVTGVTYQHTGVTAGNHCYRVVALSAQGESAPSNIACKTNVKPVGPPVAPVLKVDSPIAYNVVPNYQRFAFERGKRAGAVKIGAACDESRCIDGGFCVISRPTMMVTPKPESGTVLLAHCA